MNVKREGNTYRRSLRKGNAAWLCFYVITFIGIITLALL